MHNYAFLVFKELTPNLFKILVSFENLKKSLKKLNSFHLKITSEFVFLQLKLFKFLSEIFRISKLTRNFDGFGVHFSKVYLLENRFDL